MFSKEITQFFVIFRSTLAGCSLELLVSQESELWMAKVQSEVILDCNAFIELVKVNYIIGIIS